MPTNNQYIQRRLTTTLADHLDHPEITMLVGPRQSGKTTMLKQLDAELRAGGRKTFWLNLDFEDDFHHVSSQGALLQKIRLELGSGDGVVFIAEIQRSFRGFLERYHPERGYVVNKSLNDEAMVDETQVRCLPYWELIFEEAFSIDLNPGYLRRK